MRQDGFDADRAQLDDVVAWDDDDDDDDDGSSIAPEGFGAVHDDDGSEELEGQGESLSHSSKSPHPSSLRDWSDDDDELGPTAVLGATTLHVAAAASARGVIPPVVEVSDSLAWEPAASEPARLEKSEGGVAASKKRSQPAPPDPAQKQKKGPLPPRVKKVVKRKATEVDG
jgi:hypothetical protein